MRIGIDAKNLCGPLSGISRYLLSMVAHLADAGADLVLFAPRPLSHVQLNHTKIKCVTSELSGRLGNLYWNQFVLPGAIRQENVDVFWGPAHRLPKIASTMPSILTVHDLVWKKHPETMSRLGLLGEKLLMPGALRRADRIVCLSEFTKSDILLDYPDFQNIVRTIYPGATKKQKRTDEQLDREQGYMLFVGTQEPRKNLENLLRAYGELSQVQKQSCHLRVIGAAGWKQEHLKSVAHELGLDEYVYWSGFVDDDELERAYMNASFQVLPSIFEGFGLPIIEAQKYGKPVVTSLCSSMPEVVGEGGILVDPKSTQSIAGAMARLIDDPSLRNKLGEKAILNAARFDWAHAALDFVKLCDDLLVEER